MTAVAVAVAATARVPHRKHSRGVRSIEGKSGEPEDPYEELYGEDGPVVVQFLARGAVGEEPIGNKDPSGDDGKDSERARLYGLVVKKSWSWSAYFEYAAMPKTMMLKTTWTMRRAIKAFCTGTTEYPFEDMSERFRRLVLERCQNVRGTRRQDKHLGRRKKTGDAAMVVGGRGEDTNPGLACDKPSRERRQPEDQVHILLDPLKALVEKKASNGGPTRRQPRREAAQASLRSRFTATPARPLSPNQTTQQCMLYLPRLFHLQSHFGLVGTRRHREKV
ncbi:uncharacterized protein BDR25DRAFT_315797 [Lindgomyces ingoldianus]|uniref:Uncharacterized protein n=1 Tax=Lindgomyces ingoldianus TaxID=673940 RepID=A0ACB6QRN4_9PLEO|nr:uncharacterized protein BDR25DRAFT_315797 [Lindgomyces ingoldianus]KAF2468831.1 hypothetical protein BDR25DRAFT_315797 [Lindgomyces ingoldianus]